MNAGNRQIERVSECMGVQVWVGVNLCVGSGCLDESNIRST